ncbi:MAG: endonuclease SmrB [Candidatus Malihini olakiniferum]
MNRKYALSDDDAQLFRSSVVGTKALRQDKYTYVYRHRYHNFSERPLLPKTLQEQMNASLYFSDKFQLQLDSDGSMRYMLQNGRCYKLKKLRCGGNCSPDFFLDLHGLTQLQAKQELDSLLTACRREYICCACVMHGHGKHILKKQIPLWLEHHPDVFAFHQAPREFGGDAALFVLVKLDTSYNQIG